MLLFDLKHSGKLCEDLIIRGSNDGSNGNDKLFVNPLFKLISIEHVIIGSKTQWKTM